MVLRKLKRKLTGGKEKRTLSGKNLKPDTDLREAERRRRRVDAASRYGKAAKRAFDRVDSGARKAAMLADEASQRGRRATEVGNELGRMGEMDGSMDDDGVIGEFGQINRGSYPDYGTGHSGTGGRDDLSALDDMSSMRERGRDMDSIGVSEGGVDLPEEGFK
jgi:hypothetical protein